MMISKTNIPIFLLAIAIFLLLVNFTNELGFIGSPILLTSLVVIFTYLLLNRVEPTPVYKKTVFTATPTIIFILLTGVSIYLALNIFSALPIDEKQSDIIPLLNKIYYQRLINFEEVYAPIEGYGYGSWTPNYLPLHFLPFFPAFYFGFDPRFIALGAFLLANVYYFISLLKYKQHVIEQTIKASLPFVFLFTLFYKNAMDIANTVELLIAGYYLFLATVILNKGHGVLKSLSIVFTTLSRYTVVFFLPIQIWFDAKYNKKDFILVYGLFAFLILLIYIAPFLQEYPLSFFSGTLAYETAAQGEWAGQSWQNPGDDPFQLFRGYGFASWFYTFLPGDLLSKIKTLKYVLLGVMAVNIVFWILVQPAIKNKYLMQPVILFFTLYLFFALVLVPYNYLFWNVLFLIPVLLSPVKLIKLE